MTTPTPTPTTTKLTWGILGAGNIARSFAHGVTASQTGTLAAIGSRTQAAADRFGEEFSIAKRYPSYQAMLDDPAVQAVYIALPNHMHGEWTIRCAQAGKHILCEKPLTVNAAEAQRVIEAVRSHNVFLMEAFMYRCHPQTTRLNQVLADGAIGQVRLIEASFSYNMGPQYENIRLSNPAAGGGIMDVGCYPMSFARMVAGADPAEVQGFAQIGSVSRVDEWAAASLRFPNGTLATLTCGTQVETDSAVHIWGERGSIIVPTPWKPNASNARLRVRRDGQPEEQIAITDDRDLYAIEADTVAAHIAERQAPAMTWDDSLGNMAALDAWRHAVGLRFDVEGAATGGATPAGAPGMGVA